MHSAAAASRTFIRRTIHISSDRHRPLLSCVCCTFTLHSTFRPLRACVPTAEAFTADYAGASSIAAAATCPKPSYEMLLFAPLHGYTTNAPTGGKGKGARTGGHSSGRSGGRGGRSAITFRGRYFDAPPGAATPGALSSELRALLGMREGDPPPCLHRMRQLGYPPGYLGDLDARPFEDAPLEMYAAGAGSSTSGQGEGAAKHSRLVPTVDFPGLNVPPPPGADLCAWGWRC